IIPPAQKELFTWDSDTVISGLTADGIAEVKANGGHLVIPEGVTEIASPSFNAETGEGALDKGFSPYVIGKLDVATATEQQIIENSIITIVSFPSTLLKIGRFTFYNSANLSGLLFIPSNVVEVGMQAFGLDDYVFENKITIISISGGLTFYPEDNRGMGSFHGRITPAIRAE
ncbi:MAG: hypothetical protein U0M66_05825, partial [Bacilli bacterium]|nr:hypothetical protein [Bacilli bacterium]